MARAHCSINAFILTVVALIAIAGAAACQNTARGVQQDAQQAEEQTRDERDRAGDAAREAGKDAAEAARRVGAAAAEGAEELAERASAAAETIDVKAALMADSSVDATRIDVDTDYRTKTVTLNGYVSTEAEKAAAETIAKKEAPGWTVVNNLEVRPRG